MQRRGAPHSEPSDRPTHQSARFVKEEETVPVAEVLVRAAVMLVTFFVLFWLVQAIVIDPLRGVPRGNPHDMDAEVLSRVCPPGENCRVEVDDLGEGLIFIFILIFC